MATVLAFLVALGSATAQTYSNLHTFGQAAFSPTFALTNSDGINPCEGMVLSGSTLYGTAFNGGPAGIGTLFSMNTNGTAFSVVHSFAGGNNDGANPNGGLILSGTTLYGTANAGGNDDQGVVFAIGTSGSGYNNYHAFSALDFMTGTNTDGANPIAGLVLSGSTLYGTAPYGGAGAQGVVFSVGTGGSHPFAVLHHFSAVDPNTFTNTDGANPNGPLVLAGTTLYGTTYVGGNFAQGVIFKVKTDGTGFAVLRHLSGSAAYPTCGLALAGTNLYGLAGASLFAISTNGAGFTNLYKFNDLVSSGSDGVPGLSLSNGVLCGASSGAGASGYGQLFMANTGGTIFANYHDFTRTYLRYTNSIYIHTNLDGAFPNGGLVLVNGALYGAAADGGITGNGLLFRATPLLLGIRRSTPNILLSFATLTGQGYTVQQNTNIFGGTWTTFTNCMGNGVLTQFSKPTAGASRLFFRLRQP